ncbi:hypothetical protein VYU27_005100 [Nannochloropsis oceanica]
MAKSKTSSNKEGLVKSQKPHHRHHHHHHQQQQQQQQVSEKIKRKEPLQPSPDEEEEKEGEEEEGEKETSRSGEEEEKEQGEEEEEEEEDKENEEDDEDEEEEEEEEEEETDEDDDNLADDEQVSSLLLPSTSTSKDKSKTDHLKKEAQRYRDEIARRGVVYLSSLPPFMKPAKVKHLLEKFGPITRLYMVEEDAAMRKRRVKGGGNKKKKYVEGWVEFKEKGLAKQIAEHLNGSLVGGKKRNFYHDDMWTMKYLKGFNWGHLTEKLAYERRVREQKLRVEMMQAKKENAAFVGLVEKKRELEGMEGRRRREGKEGKEGERKRKGDESEEVREEFRVVRRFRQVAPLGDGPGSAVAREGGRKGGRKGGERGEGGMDKELLKAVFQQPRT